MIETRLWCCNIYDKTINTKSKSKNFISNSRKQKEKGSILVVVYKFDKPDINELFSIINYGTRDCHIIFFTVSRLNV